MTGGYKQIVRVSRSSQPVREGRLRFEHWHADNQVYFITARCRDGYPAFKEEDAKAVFWERFEHYSEVFGFRPWVTSLIDNHYHTIGYLREGRNLSSMMPRLHGSVAKLVNDTLDVRRRKFWRDAKGKEYFDGCIRDENQARKAYRYTCIQSQRHGLVSDWRGYAHTRIGVELDHAVKRAHELGAFMEFKPYKRYLDRGRKSTAH